MKFVKLSMLALAMGLFVASCGDGNKTEETPVDSSAVVTEPVPAPVDTMSAPAADTAAMHADTAKH